MQKKSYQEFVGWLEEIDMSSPPHNPMTLTSLLAFLWYKNGAKVLYNFEGKKNFLKKSVAILHSHFTDANKLRENDLLIHYHVCTNFMNFCLLCIFFFTIYIESWRWLVRTKYLPFLLLSKFELDLQFIQTPKLPISLFYFVPISYM